MVRRARVHSRDLQPQIAAPKGLLGVARVQRFEWPMELPTTSIDELGRKLHVGTTTEIPNVTVTIEAFDVSHNTFSYLTGHTPATFPVSGASVTELKNIDVIGQIRDGTTLGIVNALYVKRGTVTGMDATFGVRDNSNVTYTVSANSKKEFKQPVFYESSTTISGGAKMVLANTPTYLTRTSGYTINAYRTSAAGLTNYLNEGTGLDYTVAGTTITFLDNGGVSSGSANSLDSVWVTYSSTAARTFEALDDASASAVQGKYVPVTISVSNIPRVQSASLRVAFPAEEILEMGGLGKPVGYEVGIPDVTGEIAVLKTDNELLALLEGVATTTVENDLEFALTTLPLKIQLKDPRNTAKTLLTYYVPSITLTSESDENTVNQSMNETFAFQSTTGELIVMSGVGVY
jgi:hypothetical protein